MVQNGLGNVREDIFLSNNKSMNSSWQLYTRNTDTPPTWYEGQTKIGAFFGNYITDETTGEVHFENMVGHANLMVFSVHPTGSALVHPAGSAAYYFHLVL